MNPPVLRHLAPAAVILSALGFSVASGADAERPAKGVQDNSFLVEEAYNQEAGVVQHILTISPDVGKSRGAGEHEWAFNFTQEWPVFSQTHQFSYTVPYSFVKSAGRSSDTHHRVAKRHC